MAMPTVIQPIRAMRTAADCDRQAAGRHSAPATTKNATPSTATGTPASIDCGLVVTFSQLTTLVVEQASFTVVV